MESKLRAFALLVKRLATSKAEERELRAIDAWLLSRMQGHIERATAAYERIETRSAFQAAFFDVWKDVRWYLRRGRPNRKVILKVVSQWIRLVAPYVPALAEELWRSISGKGYVSLAPWPRADKSLVSEEAEAMESLVRQTAEDVENILKVTGMRPEKLYLYTSPKWKWQALKLVSEMKGVPQGALIRKAMEKEELREHGKEALSYISRLAKEQVPGKVVEVDEKAVLKEARGFFEKEFNCSVEVLDAGEDVYDPLNKRRQAVPLKPAIYVE
jgi:leucyl-tRNA synthetase